MKQLTFKKRPTSISTNYRPIFRMAIIALILKNTCRGDKGSLLKLHLLSWAISNTNNMRVVTEFIENNIKNNFQIWGIDPALNRAIDFAIAEDIIESNITTAKKITYVLTSKGREFCETIDAVNDLFVTEKSFLKQIGKATLTETLIERIYNSWKNCHV